MDDAQEKNKAIGLTGILLYDGRRFLQLLEGDRSTVETLFRKISQDDRHYNVSVLFDREASERAFGNWAMGYRSIQSGTKLIGVGLECIQASTVENQVDETIELMKNLAGVSTLPSQSPALHSAPSIQEPAFAPEVMVIDDRPANAAVLKSMLNLHGYDVSIAEDGEEGLRLIEERKPDLLLLDIDMPKLNGFEVCALMKANPDLEHIPVIFVTALTTSEMLVKAMELGAVDYITKPIRMDETMARVRTHLDVSLLRKHLRESLRDLEDKNERLRQFSKALAHDVRSPLTVVLGYVSLLLENEGASEEELEAYRAIEESGHLINEIVSSLLLLATYENDQVTCSPTDMGGVAKKCVKDLSLEIRKAGGSIEIAADMPPCMAFPPWIRRVFTNLLSNALKYGGEPPAIRIYAEAADEGGVTRYVVEDNGKGIDEAAQKKLFREFSRLEPKRAPGIGLGLVIVKSLSQKMGGRVGVRSELGQGTAFYLELPSAR